MIFYKLVLFLYLFFGITSCKNHSPPIPNQSNHKIENGISVTTTDGVITSIYFDETKTKEVRAKWHNAIGTSYVPGDVHKTDVNPLYWRSIQVQLHKYDGSIAHIKLIRPMWWIHNTQARIGGFINLEIEEAGLHGQARIIDIQNNVKQNSNNRKKGSALVIGTIKHENANIIRLELDNDTENFIGVTPNHPLFSEDRNDYVPAGQFRLGERIRTYGKRTTTVTAIKKVKNTQAVHNLEVHRAKSYYVGKQRLLAHNTGIDCLNTSELGQKIRNGEIELPDEVLFRTKATDEKGRAFGKRGNPDPPSLKTFNPRVYKISAKDIKINSTKHGINPNQFDSIKQMSNDDLIKFRPDDPISSHNMSKGGGFNVTGGHHRLNEIQRRVENGSLDGDTKIKVLLHE